MSVSLAEQFFPTLYKEGKSGGENPAQEAVTFARYGMELSTGLGATILDRLNRRNFETGDPEGFLAVKRDRMLAMLSLRAGKLRASLSRRHSLQAIYT
jgi:hypothetical protein